MNERQERLSELWDKVRDVRVAMLTTRNAAGELESRPMYTQEVDFSNGIWFFTSRDSNKATNIGQHDQVNLAYAAPDNSLYVSVSGTARLVVDREKARELWNPMNEAFFEGGVDDPELVLLEVDPSSAEMWDSPASKVRQLFSMVRSAVTGKHEDLGENKTYDL